MKTIPKVLAALATILLVAQSCSDNDNKATVSDSANTILPSDTTNKNEVTPPVPESKTTTYTYAPDSGDAKKFMVRIYTILRFNDSLSWRAQFTEEIQSRFHNPEELYGNFNVWRKDFVAFVNDNCGSDPQKMKVKESNGTLEVSAGKVTHSIRAKMVNGEWKLNEK